MNFRVLKYALVFCILAVLASCKIGKEYVRPELHVPDSLSLAGDTVSFADQDWRTVYTDTTLCRLIERALEYNKDMQIAAARIKEMAAQKRISTANLLPEFNGHVTAERESTDYGGDDFQQDDEVGARLLLSWEVDLWGKLRWARSASFAQYLQSVEARRALQMTIISEIAQAYYELIALDAELDIVKKTLDARKKGVRLERLRFEAGWTSEIPYSQAQVELARLSVLVPDLERQIALKESDIAYLAGDYPRRIARSSLLQHFESPDSLPMGLSTSLLERRPDIRQAEQRLIAAHAEAKVAYTSMFPRLSLTGKLGAESDVFSNLLKSPYSILDGVLLSPIFGWGKNRAALKSKKAAYEAEVHSYEKAVLGAFKEVHNAMVNFYKMKEVYEYRGRFEKAARNYMDLTQKQYIRKTISYLDVLDSQREYFDAQINLSNALRDELIAVVQLYKALGGGWE